MLLRALVLKKLFLVGRLKNNMEMLTKLLQSIGAIVVGGFLGWELGKLILVSKIIREEKEHNEEEE